MIKRILDKLFGAKPIVKVEQETPVEGAVKYIMPISNPDVIKYDDPVPKGFMRSIQIPDAIFDRELFVYNCGHSKKHPNDFTVLIKPMNEKG